MAPTVFEDDTVLDEMDMSGSEEIDQGESLFTKQKKKPKTQGIHSQKAETSELGQFCRCFSCENTQKTNYQIPTDTRDWIIF